MKNLSYALILIIGIFCGATCNAQEEAGGVFVHEGFLKGNDFRNYPEVMQATYVTGLIDGMFLAPLFGAPRSEIEIFESCIKGMNNIQILAIINKYLDEVPERWHESMHLLAHDAMVRVCRR